MTVAVKRPDGSVEQVRVGTAFKSDDGFSLRMGELAIGATPDPAAFRAPSAPSSYASGGYAAGGYGGGGGVLFPNYGRSKNQPVAGASMQDLEYYANGCRRTLGDPGKARWHDKERVLLAAIEEEIARQQGGGEPASSSMSSMSSPSSGSAYPEPPPHTDDDIPF